MTLRLRRYLELERLMLVLDEEGDSAADALRDAMDPLWYSLLLGAAKMSSVVFAWLPSAALQHRGALVTRGGDEG
jgi:hypothetical protein